MGETEEIRTINRVLDGDTGACAGLVATWQAPLIRFLGALLREDRRLAEDLAQDVFIEAFRRLPDFDSSRSRFSSWLFMMARSRAINALRKGCPEFVATPPEVMTPGPPVSERDDLASLDRAFHRLPADQRRALHLAVVEGLPHHEIAAIEGVAVGTIKSRVSRARDTLRLSISRDESRKR